MSSLCSPTRGVGVYFPSTAPIILIGQSMALTFPYSGCSISTTALLWITWGSCITLSKVFTGPQGTSWTRINSTQSSVFSSLRALLISASSSPLCSLFLIGSANLGSSIIQSLLMTLANLGQLGPMDI